MNTNCRTFGEVSGTVTLRVMGACSIPSSATPMGAAAVPRVSRTLEAMPPGMGIFTRSPVFMRLVTFRSSAVTMTSARTGLLAVSNTSSTGSARGVSGCNSIHSPRWVPGRGHQAVVVSPSTAAVTARPGRDPAKLVASPADDEARTCPPDSTTLVKGPTDG